MSDSSRVFLRRGDSGALAEASLLDGVSLDAVKEAEALWQPFLVQALEQARAAGAISFDLPEHKHWDWLRKARYALVGQNFRLLGTCAGWLLCHASRVWGATTATINCATLS